jgi:outer membrane protein assembly factor BamE (lipoprotein component of BamABCDE complex)
MKIFFITTILIFTYGCNTASTEYDRNSGITHGTVQLNLRNGVTTQTEVLEKFGSPNITTTDGEMEVWTYQKHGTTSKSSGAGGSLILIGGSTSGFSQNSRSMTLIIKFNKDKIVDEFNSRYSSF